MTKKKLTIAEKFEQLINLLESEDTSIEFSNGELALDFLKERFEQASNRSTSTKKRKQTPEQKANEKMGTKVYEAMKSTMEEKGITCMTAHQSCESALLFDLTSQKETSIMRQLIKAGLVQKEDGKIKDDNGRERVAYSLTD